MKIFLGNTSSKKMLEIMNLNGWGRMWSKEHPKPYPGEDWAFDNGAFAAWKKGLGFPKEDFLIRLKKAQEIGIPYLAVAPDIVGGGLTSLYFSIDWLAILPNYWPWYLAVQDGMTDRDVEPFIERFKGIFLGGTDKFKRTAPTWKRLADNYRKKFHYARVSGERKLHHAMSVHPDSIDTTQPLWSWKKFNKFVTVINNYKYHPSLLGENHYAL